MAAERERPEFSRRQVVAIATGRTTPAKLLVQLGYRTKDDDALPDGAEKSAALRKLLEAKDCAVRAALDIPAAPPAPLGPVVGSNGHHWPCPRFYVTESPTAACTCSKPFEVK